MGFTKQNPASEACRFSQIQKQNIRQSLLGGKIRTGPEALPFE